MKSRKANAFKTILFVADDQSATATLKSVGSSLGGIRASGARSRPSPPRAVPSTIAHDVCSQRPAQPAAPLPASSAAWRAGAATPAPGRPHRRRAGLEGRTRKRARAATTSRRCASRWCSRSSTSPPPESRTSRTAATSTASASNRSSQSSAPPGTAGSTCRASTTSSLRSACRIRRKCRTAAPRGLANSSRTSPHRATSSEAPLKP